MSNNKTLYKIKGMDRLENIMEKVSIEESIGILINAMIKNKGSLESIEIRNTNENEKETINIIAVGEGATSIFYIDYDKLLNDNKVLQAIISIAKELTIKASKNGIKKEQKLDLSKINSGVLQAGYISESEADFKKEKMEFIIDKKKLAINGKGLLDDKKVKNIRQYIREVYKQAINEGINIKILEDEKLEGINIDGNIINKNSCIIDNNATVFLYKLNYEQKGFEVTINDVKVVTDEINSLINWRKEPLCKKGYTFTRLFICFRLNIEDFDLNDKVNINLVIKKYEKNIIEIIRDNIENFLNENVNISLKYNRENIECIKKDLNEESSAGVVKRLLDEHINIIKNKY